MPYVVKCLETGAFRHYNRHGPGERTDVKNAQIYPTKAGANMGVMSQQDTNDHAYAWYKHNGITPADIALDKEGNFLGVRVVEKETWVAVDMVDELSKEVE